MSKICRSCKAWIQTEEELKHWNEEKDMCRDCSRNQAMEKFVSNIILDYSTRLADWKQRVSYLKGIGA